MESQHQHSETPSLDEWVAEVGEEEVAATVKRAIHDIKSGATPGFDDKKAFLKYTERRERA